MKNFLVIIVNYFLKDGMSPSGKAADSGSAIRGFKSFHPRFLVQENPSANMLKGFYIGFIFFYSCFSVFQHLLLKL